MLIAISGSQGSGKTTLLSKLEQLGYNVVVNKTARSILADWDCDLEYIYADVERIKRFQTTLIARKREDEQKYIDSDHLFFTERSYMDLFTYTVSHLGNKNQCSSWINSYYIECVELQKQYTKIFYLQNGLFELEHDGVRPSNTHFSTMIDLFMKSYILQDLNNVNINIKDVDERAQYVLSTLTC